MKKILAALAIAGFTYLSAEAQTKPLIACEAPKGKVCHRSAHGVSCYKTSYAEDYKVCKNNNGYYICCESPNRTNSTWSRGAIAEAFNTNEYTGNMDESIVLQSVTPGDEAGYTGAPAGMIAPQSQSYPAYSNNVCATASGCKKNYIKVCYGGSNVAELNRAAYQGCPTPAYDGPDRNRARNINANDPLNSMPPIEGRPE